METTKDVLNFRSKVIAAIKASPEAQLALLNNKGFYVKTGKVMLDGLESEERWLIRHWQEESYDSHDACAEDCVNDCFPLVCHIDLTRLYKALWYKHLRALPWHKRLFAKKPWEMKKAA